MIFSLRSNETIDSQIISFSVLPLNHLRLRRLRPTPRQADEQQEGQARRRLHRPVLHPADQERGELHLHGESGTFVNDCLV